MAWLCCTITSEKFEFLLVRRVVLDALVVGKLLIRDNFTDFGPDAMIENDPVTFGELVVVTNT
jgi:hypothetical protein